MLLIDKMRQLVAKFRVNDPVYNCEVYLSEGCSHVDGLLCDMKSCTIRFGWMERQSNKDATKTVAQQPKVGNYPRVVLKFDPILHCPACLQFRSLCDCSRVTSTVR